MYSSCYMTLLILYPLYLVFQNDIIYRYYYNYYCRINKIGEVSERRGV